MGAPRMREKGWRTLESPLAIAAIDQDGSDLAVAIEVFHPLPVHPEDALDVGWRQGVPRGVMVGVLDDDLTGAPAGDTVEHAEPLAPNVAFDLQERRTFRDHADEPFGAVRRLAIRPVRGNLGRGGGFVARAEGAVSGGVLAERLPLHQHPPVGGWVFPQLCSSAVVVHGLPTLLVLPTTL